MSTHGKPESNLSIHAYIHGCKYRFRFFGYSGNGVAVSELQRKKNMYGTIGRWCVPCNWVHVKKKNKKKVSSRPAVLHVQLEDELKMRSGISGRIDYCLRGPVPYFGNIIVACGYGYIQSLAWFFSLLVFTCTAMG